MLLSRVSIKRPVLASMMSLALVLFGIIGVFGLPVRELPDIDPPIGSDDLSPGECGRGLGEHTRLACSDWRPRQSVERRAGSPARELSAPSAGRRGRRPEHARAHALPMR
jgi:hypothetical protein